MTAAAKRNRGPEPAADGTAQKKERDIMQAIGKTPWKRLVPAFAAAVLVFGTMAAAPASAGGSKGSSCTESMKDRLALHGIDSISPANVAVAAEADGDFEVTWDNPDSGDNVPVGTVAGFCVEKTNPAPEATPDGLDETVCKCRSGSCPASDWGTASSLTSLTADSCFDTLSDGSRGFCGPGTFSFRVKLYTQCGLDTPWSGTVSAESTYQDE